MYSGIRLFYLIHQYLIALHWSVGATLALNITLYFLIEKLRKTIMKYFYILLIICIASQAGMYCYYDLRFDDLKTDVVILQSVFNAAVCSEPIENG